MHLTTMWPLSDEARLNHIIAGKTIHELVLERVDKSIKPSPHYWISQEDQTRLLAQSEDAILVDEQQNSIAEIGQNGTQLLAKSSFRLNYAWDLLQVTEQVVGELDSDLVEGEVHPLATVDGTLHLGKGSVILPGVYIEGNVSIGENCRIGPNCYIRGHSSIGDNVRIGQSVEVKNSLIGYHTVIAHLSYVGDSVIGNNVNLGAGTMISNYRHDEANHKSMVHGKLVDTKRLKFGSILGDGVHTAINTSIYPGRKLKAHATTRPGDIVKHDIED